MIKTLLSNNNKRDSSALLKVFLPFLLIVGMGIRSEHFVVNAIKAEPVINFGIIGVAVWGVILIIMRFWSAIIDFRVIERFGQEAAQGVYMKTLLEEPWLKKRYVRHYLKHIAETGGTLSSQMHQTAIESELHALQADYDSKLEFPQFLVGFMIAMGLLGTFIGLLETLTGISGMLAGMGGEGVNIQEQFSKLVVELRKPLAGMGIAFSASMFGLIGSLMLSAMMTNLRRYISRVISLSRNVMHELTEMTSGKSEAAGGQQHLSPEDIARMAMEQGGSGGGGGGPAGVSNTLLAGRFEILSKKIEGLLGAFEQSIELTKKTNDLLGFGPRMKETSEKTLEEIKGLSRLFVEQQALLKSTVEAGQATAQSVDGLSGVQKEAQALQSENLAALKNITLGIAEQHQISRQSLDAEQALSRIIGGLLESQKQDVEYLRQLATVQQALLDATTEQKKQMLAIVDAVSQSARAAERQADSQKVGQMELAKQMQELVTKIGKSEDIQLGSARHLFEIKENFNKLCKSLEVVDLLAASVSGQTMLLENIVEEARGSNKMLEQVRQVMEENR